MITYEVVIVGALKPRLLSPEIPFVNKHSTFSDPFAPLRHWNKYGDVDISTLGLPTGPGCWCRCREQQVGHVLGGNPQLPHTGPASLGAIILLAFSDL